MSPSRATPARGDERERQRAHRAGHRGGARRGTDDVETHLETRRVRTDLFGSPVGPRCRGAPSRRTTPSSTSCTGKCCTRTFPKAAAGACTSVSVRYSKPYPATRNEWRSRSQAEPPTSHAGAIAVRAMRVAIADGAEPSALRQSGSARLPRHRRSTLTADSCRGRWRQGARRELELTPRARPSRCNEAPGGAGSRHPCVENAERASELNVEVGSPMCRAFAVAVRALVSCMRCMPTRRRARWHPRWGRTLSRTVSGRRRKLAWEANGVLTADGRSTRAATVEEPRTHCGAPSSFDKWLPTAIRAAPVVGADPFHRGGKCHYAQALWLLGHVGSCAGDE